MAENRMSSSGIDHEDSYFHRRDAELLARKRAELDALRAAAATGSSLTCPRCGAAMAEVAVEQVKADRCTSCGGIFLDKGELELLTYGKSGGGLFKRLFGA